MTDSQPQTLAPNQKRGVLLTVLFALVFIAGVLGMFIHGLTRPHVLSDAELKANGIYLFEKPRAFQEFELVDYQSQPFTPAFFKDKWTLVFFGFTFCPDICPTTMALMNQFYQQQLEEEFGDDLQVVMVSVDPGRDTPAKLYEYVRFFNPDFMGVTGEFLDLHRFATQLNIPFKKSVTDGGESYTVDHSGNIAIINPKGHYIGFFKAPLTLSQLNMGYKSIRASREY